MKRILAMALIVLLGIVFGVGLSAGADKVYGMFRSAKVGQP